MRLVQTEPNHPLWGFCRQAGRPIGMRSTAPLGMLPESGISFTVQAPNEFEFPLGVCRYSPTLTIELDWLSGEPKHQYDGRWFFYNYCDPMSRLNRSLVRIILEMAVRTGFEVSVKDEDPTPFGNFK